MDKYRTFLRSPLFLLDPETAHNFVANVGMAAQFSPWLIRQVAKLCQTDRDTWQPVVHSGITFPNPVGLAAGFDKQARLGPLIEALGFGFGSLGSTMPLSQYGNPKPRIFRLEEFEAIINRMGFNSHGVDQFRKNLESWIKLATIPFGISLGRNKNSPSEHNDFVITLELVGPHGDFIVVNVSSPNTKGLRNLQAYDKIRQLVRMVVQKEKELALLYKQNPRPVLVKFTCDISEDELMRSATVCLEEGATGFVASNTTNSRDGVAGHRFAPETGGLSGPPIHERAVAMVATLRSIDKQPLIMGVGGVSGYDSAARMRDAGANVIKLYTSFIYHGPEVLVEARRGFQA